MYLVNNRSGGGISTKLKFKNKVTMKEETKIEAGQPPLQQAHVSGSVVSRPIIFSTEMVEAILAGRKTQTRRIIKENIIDKWFDYEDWSSSVGKADGVINSFLKMNDFLIPYAKYQVGDILWVRETFKPSNFTLNGFTYRVNAHFEMPKKGWKPSIFMPKEAARIWLRVTKMKIENLNDISETDAICEGIINLKPEHKGFCLLGDFYDYERRCFGLKTPVESYQSLWSKINGAANWDENPLVWVIEFERLEGSPEHYR